MPALPSPKHEQFAQLVAKSVNPTKAYTSVGYAEAGAAQGASRLLKIVEVSERIKELREAVSAGVVAVEIRKRSSRVAALQSTLDRMLGLVEARAIEYADHPGGSTGMLVRDYRGKDADREIWKFDAALVARITDTMKHAAIEEGQWTEKRDLSGSLGISVIKARLNAGRQRVADAKRAKSGKQ